MLHSTPLKRVVLAILLLCFVALPAAGADREVSAQTATQKPNIVFVLADDLDQRSADQIERLQTSLGEEGVTFENSFVTNSLCCPSRATALRGQYSDNHGVLTNDEPLGGYGRFDELGRYKSTVATWLKTAGYRNAFLGKPLNHWGLYRTPQPGWDRFMASSATSDKYWEYGSWRQYPAGSYKDDVITDKAVDFIERNAPYRKPLFVALWLHSPHAPHDPPVGHLHEHDNTEMSRSPSYLEEDLSDKPAWVRETADWMKANGNTTEGIDAQIEEYYRRRLEQTEALADNVESIIEALRRVGRLENTYVVFTSDNGYMLGEHHLPTYKMPPYEESIRVPLMVRGPGIPAGTVKRQMVINNDLAPTIADWAGATTPDYVDGSSFAPLAAGQQSTWRKRFLVEHWLDPYITTNAPPIPTYSELRSKRYVYVEYETGEKELYDLAADPYQLDNIAGSADPALLARLSARLEELKDCAGASCRTAETK